MILSGGEDGSICLWDLEELRLVRYFQRQQATVFSACFSPDGKMLATGGADRALTLWTVDTGREPSRASRRFRPCTCRRRAPSASGR